MATFVTTENLMTRTDSFDYPPVIKPIPIILIVEDDKDSRLMLEFLLEMWKFRVIEAADGFEAIRAAEEIRPDLILMDAKLPHLDGFETTRRFRESESFSRIPIVFLSACAEEIYRRAARAVGADDYLVKPLNFELLENILEKYVSRRQMSFRENP